MLTDLLATKVSVLFKTEVEDRLNAGRTGETPVASDRLNVGRQPRVDQYVRLKSRACLQRRSRCWTRSIARRQTGEQKRCKGTSPRS